MSKLVEDHLQDDELVRLCWLQWNTERLRYGGHKRVLAAPFPPPPMLEPHPSYEHKRTAQLPSMSREALHNMMRSNRDKVG